MLRLIACCVAASLLSSGTSLAQFNVPATTVQLPTFGVAVDADGLLAAKMVRDPGGRLRARMRAAAIAGLPGELRHAARMRFVSLAGLDAELQ